MNDADVIRMASERITELSGMIELYQAMYDTVKNSYDAAIADMQYLFTIADKEVSLDCAVCKHCDTNGFCKAEEVDGIDAPCDSGDLWQWRGVQERDSE